MPWLNKKQTDLLGWTEKDDPNDVIIVDGEGNIIKRRPMLALFPQGENGYVNMDCWYELNSKGYWIFKQEKRYEKQN